MSAQRYPLAWPTGWPRSRFRVRAKFGKGQRQYNKDGQPTWVKRTSLTVADATKRLVAELERLDARNEILSTNIQLRLDGLPRSDQRQPADPGAAVYFDLKKKPMVLACDKWDRVEDNIAAIALHIEALRGMERWGVGSIAQAFAGYTALPAAETDWWVILGFPDPLVTADEVREQHRALAREHHPDAGGSGDFMARLNDARDRALKALGGA